MTFAFKRSHRRAAIFACSLFACVSGTHNLQASSADAWEEFRQDVEKTCLEAVNGLLLVGSMQVDPFGSESYGFALMIGIEPGTSNERVIACAYDKQSQKAEISGYF